MYVYMYIDESCSVNAVTNQESWRWELYPHDDMFPKITMNETLRCHKTWLDRNPWPRRGKGAATWGVAAQGQVTQISWGRSIYHHLSFQCLNLSSTFR